MTIAVVIGAFTLIFLNLSPFFSASEKNTYIAMNNVRGAAVIYKQKPYTLNFEQQTKLIDIMNRAVLVKKSDYAKEKKTFSFDEILIYPFAGSPIELKPIDSVERNIVFSVPLWSQDYYLMELSAGSLQDLIDSTHD